MKAWSLRETDLFSYQRGLDRFDESRINGNFVDEKGNPADLYHQRVCHARQLPFSPLRCNYLANIILEKKTLLYLIRRSYAWIYLLIISSEPVSEALVPVYNQLSTLRRCLEEVKKSGGVSSLRELYPYSMKVSSSHPHHFPAQSAIPMSDSSCTIKAKFNRQSPHRRKIHGQ